MPPVARTMQRVSHHLTRQIGLRFGERFPFWYVVEHPKSGGTWLARMIADYLDIPLCEHSLLPVAMRCVLFGHWGHDPRFHRCFYLCRDGRDVLVSLYFHRMRIVRSAPDSPAGRHWRRRLGPMTADEPGEIAEGFADFVRSELASPGARHANWPAHVRDWRRGSEDRVAFLTYEELRRDPAATLARCLNVFLREPACPERVKRSVDRFRFASMSGREPGQEDRRSFLRKGIVGDWKNYFSREAALAFDRCAGDMLIELGYEADRSWLETTEFVA